MRLAARFGQGWVTTGTGGRRPGELVGDRSSDCPPGWTVTLDEAGRDPATLDRYLSLDAAPVFSLSSAEFFADAGRPGRRGSASPTW